jgi:hypothetical protein
VQWSRSYEQDSPKIIPSPWGLHCRLRVKSHIGEWFKVVDELVAIQVIGSMEDEHAS